MSTSDTGRGSDDAYWFVTADERVARLFSCTRTPAGTPHVYEIASIQNGHEMEHERGRPDMLSGGARAPGAGGSPFPHLAAWKDTEAEENRRFAREVSRWLTSESAERKFDRPRIFAASRFLGLLRKEMPDGADLYEAELTRLQPGALAKHPAVKEAFPWRS
ncbi:MAG: host attachment protein [Planctomycetota bacterium]|nr:host attachment protein [Planctomycetota bacterium]